MYGVCVDTLRLLQESSKMMDDWASDSCAFKCQGVKGGMEQWAKEQAAAAEESLCCDWYHSTWQYLRLLNMVAVPNWYGFYVKALGDVLKQKPSAQVFISACADYGMLAKLHEAIQAVDANPTIAIYDICETPLKSAQWYAERFGLTVLCKVGNIITGDIPEAPFDLIVTDEFLTVLKDEYKPEITARWKQLLKPDGVLVTTAMIGKPTTPELRAGYAARARQLYEIYGKMVFPNHEGRNLLEKFEKFAAYHTRHMMRDETQLKELFKEYKYFSYDIMVTPGECVNPTPSFQIVASPGA